MCSTDIFLSTIFSLYLSSLEHVTSRVSEVSSEWRILLYVYMYSFGIFLLFFIEKSLCLWSFSLFFWWSVKFPQQNVNQSETGSNAKKKTTVMKLNFGADFCFRVFQTVRSLLKNYFLSVFNFEVVSQESYQVFPSCPGLLCFYKLRFYRMFQPANLLKMNFMFDFIPKSGKRYYRVGQL